MSSMNVKHPLACVQMVQDARMALVQDVRMALVQK